MKPFAEACERNREPILEVLHDAFRASRDVLEIGSGTGQHAVYFGARLPHLTWQTSDLVERHAGIRQWLDEARLPNVLAPFALDVQIGVWPPGRYDGVFTANTLHIVSWQAVQCMFDGIGRTLQTDGICAVYGPFNYGGRYTAESNARFDGWLRSRDSASGIRDFEQVDALAREHGLELAGDIAMPADNRTLLWRRLSPSTQ